MTPPSSPQHFQTAPVQAPALAGTSVGSVAFSVVASSSNATMNARAEKPRPFTAAAAKSGSQVEASRPSTAPSGLRLYGDFTRERELLSACRDGKMPEIRHAIERQKIDPKIVVPQGIDGRPRWSVRKHLVMFEPTNLAVAARLGNIELVEYLTQHGADTQQIDQHGSTPLASACEHGHHEIAQFFVEKWSGVDKLLGTKKCEASVNHQDEKGCTPLFRAAQQGHAACVELLLANGANCELHTKRHCTPCFAACQEGHLDVVELLARSGADIEVPNEHGTTPFAVAASRGHVQIVKYLADRECALDPADSFGRTPFYLALQQAGSGDGSHFAIAHFLFEKEVNVNAEYAGHTAMELCSVLAAKAKAIEVKEQYIEMRDTIRESLMPPSERKAPDPEMLEERRRRRASYVTGDAFVVLMLES